MLCFVLASLGPAPEAPRDPALAREILRRADRDQKVRGDLVSVTFASPKYKGYQAEVQRVDRDNTARMKQIVARYGWPGRSLLGEKAASAAWLMIQHADADRAFQRRCFPLVLKALEDGDIARPDAALFIDRVLVGEGRKQLYGSQFKFDGKGGMAPDPIMDPATLEQRRKAMHLVPMSEYRKLLEQVYKSALKPQPTKN